MKTKLVRVPFGVEMAKKITNGEIEGKIVTRDGRSARVICWDLKAINKSYCILALIDNGNEEVTWTYSNKGFSNTELESKCDLMLEIPEYRTFKDGDVIAFGNDENNLVVGIFKKRVSETSHECYVMVSQYGNLTYDANPLTYKNARFATEEEKQKLIDALKASKEPKAKEYLKRFFGIEQKQECEFKPFDKVLVRDSEDKGWIPDFFWCKVDMTFRTIGGTFWNQCIPYNDQTAHLLGTTEDYNG